ncbi:efflux RND transporter periplasmic adaptor subunit [Riemerella anatipestifer]|uniref:efflux RND transporter periplasmic adaptor subunit n=1 Tax=Riemerella anatipestifer TaxID=34085 RepID=UPI0030C0F2C2
MLTSCNNNADNKNEKKQNAVAVSLLTTEKHLTNSTLSVSGNIEGNKTVKVGFLVAGRISSSPFEEGNFVKRGQVVTTIDPVNYEIGREASTIQLNQANDEYRRIKIMHERGSVSEADFQKVTAARNLAEQQVRSHRENVSETKIYAPFSGIVIKKLSEKGEIIGQGMPVWLFRILLRSMSMPISPRVNLKT